MQLAAGADRALAIDERVQNVLPVLLHQVVDVAENSAAKRASSAFIVLQLAELRRRAGQLEGDLPHSETRNGLCSTVNRSGRGVVGCN